MTEQSTNLFKKHLPLKEKDDKTSTLMAGNAYKCPLLQVGGVF